MNTIYKVHITKSEEEEVPYMNQKRSYLTHIGKNVQCVQNLVTGCESKNMMEVALHRSDCISIHYCNGHYSNECCRVMGMNTCNGASFVTVMPLW